jgi:hypothetical protein
VTKADPKSPLSIRWTGILWGLVTIIWLPIEDSSTFYLIAISAGWSAWSAARWIHPRSRSIDSRRALLVGAGAGVLIFPFAMALTGLKAGLHDHGFLDFTNSQLLDIAKATPLWAAIGALISALWLKAAR